MTRRTFLQGLLVAGSSVAAAGLLAACGGTTAAAPTTGAAAATSAPAAGAAATATSAPAAGAAATATTAPIAPTAAAAPTPATVAATATSSTAASAAPTAGSASGLAMTQYPLKKAKLVAWAWQSFTPSADRWIAEQAGAWGKANGGTVEYDVVQNSVFTQKLAAAIEAKSVPDVIMLSDVLYYQGLNILTDLTAEYQKLDKMGGGFYPSLLPGIQVNKKVWGIPIESGPSPLFSRLDVIQQATGNRQPPKTLDEMEAIGKKVNKPTSFYAIGWTLGRTPDCEGNISDIIRNDGGAKVTKDGTKPAIMSAGTIAAMTRVKRWWDEKLIPPDSVSWDDIGNNSAYQSKRVAFVDNPASIYAWLVSHDHALLANTSMSPIPSGKAGSFGGGAGGWSWTVNKTGKNPEASIALVDFLMLPNNLELECEKIQGRWYPTYQDLAKSPFWQAKPQFAQFPALIKSAVYDSYPAQPLPKLMAALGEVSTSLVISDMTQAIIVNNTPIDQAVKDAQAKMEAIFKKHGLG